ncbi:calcitonin gene-related peptide type 1 receptor [Galendromus occidentalis]|uniref:Calcitonin gene-related peptide type 1 receptor n=1 Tax=Galendromus occidentalis TaxID=34638 RepID=A0AAJ6QSV7_9ACAR|nr:calcitonin gene-related peptide type 1 receptor [Galendromus occidentalis]
MLFWLLLGLGCTAAKEQDVHLMMSRINEKVKCDLLAREATDDKCPPFFNGFVCLPQSSDSRGFDITCPGSSLLTATYECLPNGSWHDVSGYEKVCNLHHATESFASDRKLIDDLTEAEQKRYARPWDPYRPGEDAEVKITYFRRCLEKILLDSNRTEGVHCERHFDGWGCWKDTPPGETASISCPHFVPGFISKLKASKVCHKNGSWAYNRATNRHRWADYSGCVSVDKLRLSEIGVNIYISGYTVSLIALSLSLAIFFYFRSALHCVRVTIHKNLFASFIISNLCWLAWYIEASRETFLVNNSMTCQLLHVITHYFLLSNYFWMFNEGLYLHTVLVFSFVSEKKLVYYFYLIGWILPALIIVAYAVPRALDPTASASCWTDASTIYTFVLSIPITLSIIVNFVFLINIVRVLWSKLKAPAQSSQESSVPIKAIRAALILLPLLGLHYIFTPFRPGFNSSFYEAYEIYSAVTTSYQGLAVAILFCLCNQEVIAQFKRKIQLTSCFKHRYIQCSTNGHRPSTVGSIL